MIINKQETRCLELEQQLASTRDKIFSCIDDVFSKIPSKQENKGEEQTALHQTINLTLFSKHGKSKQLKEKL